MSSVSRSRPRPTLSLVVPVFNEIGVLREFHQRAAAALAECCETYVIYRMRPKERHWLLI